MKGYIFSLLILCMVFYSSSAQDCTQETLLQKTGVWKPGMKGSIGGTATEVAKEKKVIETIHAMVKSKYTPTAVEAIFHGAYESHANMPANDFTYSIIPLNYYCEGNVTKVAHETPTWFQISANIFESEIYDPFDVKEASSGTGFHYILDMPVEKDGYWYFPEKDAGLGFGMKGKSSAWLVTYTGRLPFAYVTKREFLQTQKIILANAQKMAASGFKDVLDRLEMEKGFKEKEYKNDPQKMAHYMKMVYNDSKPRYEKLLAGNDAKFKPAFDKIESQLKMSDAELSRPAIVKMDPHDHLAHLFTDDSDPMGLVLIKPNPGYFNTKLPRSSPQFFWIYVRADHKEPIASKFMSEIIKAVDFAMLKSMLGK